MHKKLLISIFFLASLVSYGQTGQFFDAPFGGGIGYVPAWYIPNVSPINNQIIGVGIPELSTSGFYSSGIAGFIYIGFVKNLRIGGMGFGGSISTTHNLNNFSSEIIYSLGGGGITVEYTLPFIKNFGVSVGAAIGSGSLEIDLFKNYGNYSWVTTWEEFFNGDFPVVNYNRKLKNSFWMFTPTINLDYPLYRFVTIRLGFGYQLTFADDWTADNDQRVSNIPSDLNSNSFFIQSGIFVGFFSF